MNQKAIDALEFDKIRLLLAGYAGSAMGKEKALTLLPEMDFDQVQNMQQETSEACTCLNLYPNLPRGGARDIRSPLKRASIGGLLEPSELLDVAQTLQSGRRVKKVLAEMEQPFVLLNGIAQQIGVFRDLEDIIQRVVNEQGEIKDEASPELSRIRRSLQVQQQRVREKLESLLRSAEHQKMLQEVLITIRDGRYVLPVRQEYRSQFSGIVHDQSSSGATVYIEPMATVAMNNEIKQQRLAEQAEIQRILQQLTGKISARLPELQDTLEAMAALDFVFAKAVLSTTLRGVEPLLNRNGKLSLLEARHPLIGQDVVPITVSLGDRFSILVVSGPNTGGKTVTLKTVGLLALMCQAGLHIPALSGSEMPVYQQIFADIGDEQSIEQSLSTFSAHMTNLVKILQQLQEKSLVLIDEIGAGTDPGEGAALAMAMLDEFRRREAKVIATTHYSELKTFAYSRDGVENSSVEFDVVSLRPTYRLLIGVPGQSNAFAIASRLGLDQSIVENARKLMTTEHAQLDQIIRKLTDSQLYFEQQSQQQRELNEQLQHVREELLQQQRQIKEQQQAMLAKAREQARRLLQQTKFASDQIMNELKELSKQQNQQVRQQAILNVRAKLRSAGEELREDLTEKVERSGEKPDFTAGESVYLPQYQQSGLVLEGPDTNDEVLVQVGVMKIKLPATACEKTRTPLTLKRKQPQMSGMTTAKAQTLKPELDLRGMTVEEAQFSVDKYLDDAYLINLNQVAIIHGKGTGALRKAMNDMLKWHPRVKSYRLGGVGEGGSGVTIIEIK